MKYLESKGLEIIKKVAVQNHTSVEEVRSEIELAIDIGLSSNDPQVVRKWKSLCKNNKKPTPEELIMKLCNSTEYYTKLFM